MDDAAVTRRTFFVHVACGSAVGGLLLADQPVPEATPVAGDDRCDHDLRLFDPRGSLLGTWEATDGRYGPKICCRNCGRFYGYVHPQAPDACWWHPWDALDDELKNHYLTVVGVHSPCPTLTTSLAEQLSEVMQDERYWP